MSFEIQVEQWRGSSMVQRIDPMLRDASWEYARFGGCGRGDFGLALAYESAMQFASDDEIRAYARTDPAAAFTLFYRGLVTSVEPQLGLYDAVRVGTMGYKLYLDRITLDTSYAATEVSVIVKDILDTYVVPSSNITYVAGDIDATAFTPDSVTFLSTAAEAIDLLAKLGGMMEYGVDRNGKFFFQTPSAAVGFRFPFGRDVVTSDEMWDWEKIVNQVIVRGAGTTKRTRNDASSQTKYGIRAAIVHNTAATTNAVADQYGDAILADQAEVDLRSRVTMAQNTDLIESTRPLPRAALLKTRTHYAEAKYGTVKYQGDYQYRINRITYAVTELGFRTDLDLGRPRPRLADTVFQLASNIRAARPT